MPITRRKINIPGTTITVMDIKRFIENCYDIAILRDLNECLRQQMRGNVARAVMREIDINDRVRFVTNSGSYEGIVTAILRTKVKVRVFNAEQQKSYIWRVPATLLERLS